jgi:hypothetical protein
MPLTSLSINEGLSTHPAERASVQKHARPST